MAKEKTNHIVIAKQVQKRFDTVWDDYQILFFQAPCGYGKTVSAKMLLKKKNVSYRSCRQPRSLLTPLAPGIEAVIIDDLQDLENQNAVPAIDAMIKTNPEVHFLFLSRGALPDFLIPYQMSNTLAQFEPQIFILDRDDFGKCITDYGLHISQTDIDRMYKEANGWPAAVTLDMGRLRETGHFSGEARMQIYQDAYAYINKEVFRRFDRNMRTFLLRLVPFESFSAEMAHIVCPDTDVRAYINRIFRETSMFVFKDVDEYRLLEPFRDFLHWIMYQECTQEEIKEIYYRAALCFELQGDYLNALKCYEKIHNTQMISELLIKYSGQRPDFGYYYDLLKYYRQLPEETIKNNAKLICSMSMLESLDGDYERGSYWYQALVKYEHRLDPDDQERIEAGRCLYYLDFALPQHNHKDLVNGALRAAAYAKGTGQEMPVFSLTGLQPGFLSGSKDLCPLLEELMSIGEDKKAYFDRVFGKHGFELIRVLQCEYRLECGEDISDRLLMGISTMHEMQRQDRPDIEFATIGILIRSQIAKGDIVGALNLMQNVYDDFHERGLKIYMGNLKALRCQLYLYHNEIEAAKSWLKTSPDSLTSFKTLYRFQYLTKAMIQITLGKIDEALILLAQVYQFAENGDRTIDRIQILTLMAIARYRWNNTLWRQNLSDALEAAEPYQLVAVIGRYGTAVVPLLEELKRKGRKSFYDAVKENARKYAVHYPHFMESPKAQPKIHLTPMEQNVLRLVCQGMRNQEIADLLNVQLSTVKPHVYHIMQKLQVKNRTAAREAAEQYHLLDLNENQ